MKVFITGWVGALIFLLALSAIVKADGPPGPHQEHPEDLPLHEQFYSKWQMPNGGKTRTASCCNKADCYPTAFKLEGGTWFAQRREDGMWMAVPASKLEQEQTDPEESPDGLGHVCAAPPAYDDEGKKLSYFSIFCAVLGVQI